VSTVKLKSTLPAGLANGLTQLANALVHDPQQFHVVLAFVDCAETTVNTDTGEAVPTARIRRVVAIPEQDLPTARRLMMRAMQDPSGQTSIPWELEEEMDAAFRTPNEH
jgi:hypothetical protein